MSFLPALGCQAVRFRRKKTGGTNRTVKFSINLNLIKRGRKIIIKKIFLFCLTGCKNQVPAEMGGIAPRPSSAYGQGQQPYSEFS